MPDSRERLIVALDVPSVAEARRIADAIGDNVSIFKVGKQLFTAAGPTAVRELIASGRQVFLDLKFYDIPNTVSGAVRAACALAPRMLTVHASGGSAMLRAAVDAANCAPVPPLLLAVTVLTSFADPDLQEIGLPVRVADQVLRLAALARRCGCRGVIASPREIRLLRKEFGPELVIVTPGVRPAGMAAGDQARVATAGEAIADGADYVIVGRPITQAPDPARAAQDIVEEISSVMLKK